jgi:hypothetical protein
VRLRGVLSHETGPILIEPESILKNDQRVLCAPARDTLFTNRHKPGADELPFRFAGLAEVSGFEGPELWRPSTFKSAASV